MTDTRSLFYIVFDQAKLFAKRYETVRTAAPRSWIVMVTAMTISGFAHMLALFLPLKVILIAGSDSIPGYMEKLPLSASHAGWVIGLTLAAVFLLLLSISLNTIVSTLVGRSGDRLTAIVKNQSGEKTIKDEKVLKRTLRGILDTYSDGLTIVLAGAAMATIQPAMLLATLCLFVVEIFFTDRILNTEKRWLRKTITSRVRRNYGLYLRYWMAVNFFLVFFVLLADFLIAPAPEVIPVLLALVLYRKLAQSVDSIVKKGLETYRARNNLDRLLGV